MAFLRAWEYREGLALASFVSLAASLGQNRVPVFEEAVVGGTRGVPMQMWFLPRRRLLGADLPRRVSGWYCRTRQRVSRCRVRALRHVGSLLLRVINFFLLRVRR